MYLLYLILFCIQLFDLFDAMNNGHKRLPSSSEKMAKIHDKNLLANRKFKKMRTTNSSAENQQRCNGNHDEEADPLWSENPLINSVWNYNESRDCQQWYNTQNQDEMQIDKLEWNLHEAFEGDGISSRGEGSDNNNNNNMIMDDRNQRVEWHPKITHGQISNSMVVPPAAVVSPSNQISQNLERIQISTTQNEHENDRENQVAANLQPNYDDNSVNIVQHFLALTMECIGIKNVHTIVAGATIQLGTFQQLFNQFNANHVFQCLIDSLMNQNNNLDGKFWSIGQTIYEIEAQQVQVFGKSLFSLNESSSMLNPLPISIELLAEQLKTLENHPIQDQEKEKKLQILFFYMRFYRKLIGKLKALHTEKNTQNFEIVGENKKRNALLFWLSIAKQQFNDAFDIKLAEIERQYVKTYISTKLDAIDWATECIGIVHYTVENTVIPLVGEAYKTLDKFGELVSDLSKNKKNFAKIIMETANLDMKNAYKITIQNALSHQNRMGITVAFDTIFTAAIRQFDQKYSSAKNVVQLPIQNVHIYAFVYERMNNFLSSNVENIFSSNEKMEYFFSLMKKFFQTTLKQLNKFVEENEEKMAKFL